MITLSYSIDQFLQLEKTVWNALVSGDAALDAKMLDDKFLGVYGSGFAGKADHVGQLIDGPTIAAYELLQPKLMVLAQDVVLLSYLARYRRRSPGEAGNEEGNDEEAMYVTSIWQEIDGVWKNIFSQDTPKERDYTNLVA